MASASFNKLDHVRPLPQWVTAVKGYFAHKPVALYTHIEAGWTLASGAALRWTQEAGGARIQLRGGIKEF